MLQQEVKAAETALHSGVQGPGGDSHHVSVGLGASETEHKEQVGVKEGRERRTPCLEVHEACFHFP